MQQFHRETGGETRRVEWPIEVRGQRIARIDIKDSIDVKTLTELVLFIENAVMREKRAVHHSDRVHGFTFYFHCVWIAGYHLQRQVHLY